MSDVATKSRRTERRRAKHFTMRNAHTGQFLTVKQAKHAPLPKEIGRSLAMPTNSVAIVLDALRAAAFESRNAGTALQFVVEVEPNGEPRIVQAFGDPLQTPSPTAGALEMGADEAAELDVALDEARERGRHAVAEILAGADMLSADAFAAHLKMTRETVNSRRKTHQVLALQGATRGYRYPVWQVGEDGRPFSVLPTLFNILDGDPWEVYRLLAQRHAEFEGLTGWEALGRRQDEAVVETARGIAQGTFA
ncbi:XRE family transcriptional regulator [Novosphingobium sp. 9U]|uniref:XRE family transcriptional regulator n=1 Tax=Novosphingobium sp. 9U TaxID=2653158 RepID=UPI0013577B31|nr:XRE family transcriptional regulator [Novosphingobium sp. 9U]